MIQKLLKPFIYPYEVSFWVEGSADNNLAILKEFIEFNSFKLIREKDGEIQFSFNPSKLKCRWMGKTISTFTRYSPTRCKMSFHFVSFRNGSWVFLSLFVIGILYTAITEEKMDETLGNSRSIFVFKFNYFFGLYDSSLAPVKKIFQRKVISKLRKFLLPKPL